MIHERRANFKRIEQEQLLFNILITFVIFSLYAYILFALKFAFIHKNTTKENRDIKDLHTYNSKEYTKIILFINDDHGISTQHEQFGSTTVYTKTKTYTDTLQLKKKHKRYIKE